MKSKFELVNAKGDKSVGLIEIIGKEPDCKPYISMAAIEKPAFVKDKELELFAVNILKALKSKKLK